MNNNPIGIFDSGVGGISVWKEIIKELPHESTCYYADSINCPYGIKSQDEIINLSPVSELTTSNFYESEVDFQNALISAYDVLQEKNKIDYVMSEIKSDNGHEMKYQYEKDIDNFSVSSTNELISEFWKIKCRCNCYIEYCCTDSELSNYYS